MNLLLSGVAFANKTFPIQMEIQREIQRQSYVEKSHCWYHNVRNGYVAGVENIYGSEIMFREGRYYEQPKGGIGDLGMQFMKYSFMFPARVHAGAISCCDIFATKC